LKAESVDLFFEPSLTSTGADVLNEWFGETDSQFGCGLCVNTTDRPGKRRKGSGWCEFSVVSYNFSVFDARKGYGWANTYHFLDPETGVALVFGSQLLPTRDGEILKLWDELELVFYDGLVK
jgi:ABC-type Fe3+ transport system substrate-binding protein